MGIHPPKLVYVEGSTTYRKFHERAVIEIFNVLEERGTDQEILSYIAEIEPDLQRAFTEKIRDIGKGKRGFFDFTDIKERANREFIGKYESYEEEES